MNRANGRRLTTFLLTYPRFIHSEILTHRVFARNSASSRAVPVMTVLRSILFEPVLPVRWGRAKKGMQDGGALPASAAAACRLVWLLARYPAMLAAWLLVKFGLHKQVANRLLEPWAHMTVVLTGTEWKNFYRLRFHPDAQPEFRQLAETMLRAHAASVPQELDPGMWHVPFLRDADLAGASNSTDPTPLVYLLKRATARCARTSYVNFFGRDSVEDDFRLHDTLSESGHWSPFEHCAEALEADAFCGNLRGYKPYRKDFPRETWDDGTPFDPRSLLTDISGSQNP